MHPLLWKLMISKNKIKLLKSLKLKKYREEYQLSIIEGLRLVEEAINFNTNINHIWITKELMDINQDLLKKITFKKINYDIIDQKNLKLISDTNNNQGIIAEIDIKEHFNVKLNDIKSNNIVILDNISDPGNLGTIFRTCAWYNIKNIILTSNTVDPFNFKSLRSGMGAHFTFNFIVKDSHKNIIDFLNKNQFEILCSDLEGEEITEIVIKKKWALILGSEAHGISDEFNKYNKITIPSKGIIESLNVSVACGIILERLVNYG